MYHMSTDNRLFKGLEVAGNHAAKIAVFPAKVNITQNSAGHPTCSRWSPGPLKSVLRPALQEVLGRRPSPLPCLQGRHPQHCTLLLH